MDTTARDDGLSQFVSVRPRLFGIAYRMLGSAVEAEDVVQDVWLRWQTTDRSVVRNAPAFLTTATMRLAINVAQSARSRRDAYIGPWHPEPVDTSADPGLGAERGEALGFAVLLLLEKLSPRERAAYVLREAFDYSYQQIADILRLSEGNARQLVTRARKHIADGRRAPVSSAEQGRLLDAFIAAAESGDLVALEDLFTSRLLFGWRRVRARGAKSRLRSRARREVHCGGRFPLLDRRDGHEDRGEWTGSHAAVLAGAGGLLLPQMLLDVAGHEIGDAQPAADLLALGGGVADRRFKRGFEDR